MVDERHTLDTGKSVFSSIDAIRAPILVTSVLSCQRWLESLDGFVADDNDPEDSFEIE